jgi:hypothetical protein
MVDLTDFKKYKIIYLVIILLSAFLIAFQTTPVFHRVFVDIAVEPPENVRKTDFSWITVNEWFVTQIRLIKSDAILEGVKSDIGKQKLQEIIWANRLGGANIIRISVCSDVDPVKIKSLVNDLASFYVDQLNNPAKESEKPDKESEGAKKEPQVDRKRIIDALLSDRMKIKVDINTINRRLKDNEAELKLLEAQPMQLKEIKVRIETIDKTLIPLKTELEQFRLSYTDNWGQNAKLIKEIDIWETERQKVASNLPAAQKLEDRKTEIISKKDLDKLDVETLQNELKTIDIRLAQAELGEAAKNPQVPEGALKKATPSGRIITSSAENTQKVYPNLGIRLLIASIIGVLFWFLIGLVFNNAYLFFIFKNRIFRRK